MFEHDTCLDCILCKTVMLDPRECQGCRKGFCRKCIDSYVSQMIEGEYEVTCPNCSAEDFKVVDPHPMVMKALAKIEASCENSDKGCTVNVSYRDLAKHQQDCLYATLRCTNYGCEAEMLQRDYKSHEESCQFRVIRCKKCDVVIKEGKAHDCISQMGAKFQYLEDKLSSLASNIEREIDRGERKRLAIDRGTILVRRDLPLLNLSQVRFNAQNGWHQSISEKV